MIVIVIAIVIVHEILAEQMVGERVASLVVIGIGHRGFIPCGTVPDHSRSRMFPTSASLKCRTRVNPSSGACRVMARPLRRGQKPWGRRMRRPYQTTGP